MGNDTRTTRPFNHQGPFLLDALICLLFTLLVRVSSSVSGIRKHRTYPLSLVILILGLCIPLSVQALQGSYDTCQEAIALSLNSQEIGILSSSLDQDWYLVTFSPQGRLTASLSSQKNYQLSLYSSCDSNPICTSTNKCIQDPALGTYYLKVHSSGSADDSVYTIGAMFENTAINSDLYIHNIWAADNVVGEIPTEIYWQISNTGSPITQPFVLKFTLDGQTIHSTTIQSISIQEQIAGSFPVTTTIGTHTLLASVDDGKTIIESDESNNEFSASFYFAQALPDLKVTRIYEEEGLSPNKASIIKYTFNNIGLVDSSPTTYAVYVDGSLYETRSLKSIVPQEEYIQSTTLQFESGDHSILISVDPDNTLQEIKETNNQLSQTFTWAGKPDLQVHDLRIPPDTCSEDIVLVEFSLYNLGSSGSGVFSTSLYVNGDLQKTWTDTALASGDYLSKSYSRSFNKGINTLKVIIDEGDQVDETIEYNNELLISPDVGSCHFKNLELMDAVINPSPLLEGQDFEILAEITSTGDPIPDPFTSVIRNEQGEIISFCDRLAPLGTNDSFSCTFDMPGLGVGAHQFTIDLDSNTQITELGNENNSYPLVSTFIRK